MTLKMQNILGFSNFYNIVKDQKLSVRTAYNLAVLMRAIETEMEFYRKKFQEIIMEYGELDEKGNPIPVAEGNGVKLRQGVEAECYKALEELQNLEIALPNVFFTLEDFNNVELTVNDIGAIIPFIKD